MQFLQSCGRPYSMRVLNHTTFKLFDHMHFFGLLFNGHTFMNNANATLSGNSNS